MGGIMALTHRIVKHIELAHERGEWIEVRMPSLSILDRARQAKARQAIEMMAGMDLSRYKDLAPSESRESKASDTFDAHTLLSACILSWSYADPVTPDNVAELDGVTVEAVLAELVPGEGDQKKG